MSSTTIAILGIDAVGVQVNVVAPDDEAMLQDSCTPVPAAPPLSKVRALKVLAGELLAAIAVIAVLAEIVMAAQNTNSKSPVEMVLDGEVIEARVDPLGAT
jgi:hypothetical protein